MNILSKIRFKKIRLWAGWLYFVVFGICAKTSDKTFIIALGVIILGLGLRLWASGYIDKLRKLAASGPYAFVRNPFYLGTFFVGLGFSLLDSEPYFLILFILIFWFFYYFTIKQEEITMARFGSRYVNYLKNVPSFIPRFIPYSNQDKEKFNWQLALKNGEPMRASGILILLIFFYFRQEFIFKNKRIDSMPNLYFYFLILILLILGIIANVIVKRKIDINEKQISRIGRLMRLGQRFKQLIFIFQRLVKR